MKVIKGFKIRIYPNKEQKILIEKHFGCCRFIWNYMLDKCINSYQNHNQFLSCFDLIKNLTLVKKEKDYIFLKEVSNKSLETICRDLSKRMNLFSRNVISKPKFKSKKKSKLSYPVRSDVFCLLNEKHFKIEKLGKVKFKTDFKFEINQYGFKNVRLNKEGNKYYVSFSLEIENQEKELNDYKLGIDLGIKEQAVCFCNNESYFFRNINKDEKMKKLFNKEKLLQRNISRKYRQNNSLDNFQKVKHLMKTKNIQREEEKLRKLRRKISNIRRNYIYHIINKLINLLPQEIIVETLNVRGMLKNHKLAKHIQQQNFFTFKQILKYKSKWLWIKFTEANRFYPSSKTCNRCGYIKRNLKLNARIYKCDECDLILDRDLNSAINLANYTI